MNPSFNLAALIPALPRAAPQYGHEFVQLAAENDIGSVGLRTIVFGQPNATSHADLQLRR